MALRDPALPLVDGDAEPAAAERAVEIEAGAAVAAAGVERVDRPKVGDCPRDQAVDDTVAVFAGLRIAEPTVDHVRSDCIEGAEAVGELRPEIEKIVVAAEVAGPVRVRHGLLPCREGRSRRRPKDGGPPAGGSTDFDAGDSECALKM
jgi:hypothetical protein